MESEGGTLGRKRKNEERKDGKWWTKFATQGAIFDQGQRQTELAMKGKRSVPLGRRKTNKGKVRKTASAKAALMPIPVTVEVVPAGTEKEVARFRVPPDVRVRVLCLNFMRHPVRAIAEQVELSPTTVQKIIHEAPEKRGMMLAMRDAGIMGLLEIIPDAVKAVEVHIREGKDLGGSLAILRGLQLLNPKTEFVEEKKEEPMTEEEVKRRLRELLEEGAKNME